MKLDPWSFSERGTEYSEQVALFSFCNMAANYGLEAAYDPTCYNEKGYAKLEYEYEEPIPILKRLFAIHNQGTASAIQGARASAEGLKAGIPDMCLPIPRYVGLIASKLLHKPPYDVPKTAFAACGLYIELKRRANKTVGKAKGVASDKQKDWMEFLQSQGYQCNVCYGWEEARDVILEYLDLV